MKRNEKKKFWIYSLRILEKIEGDNMPFISVIMPVYNVEKYLRDSVSSVLQQTYRDFELILVDDGSPDNCPQICDEYAERDSRIKVIHKENGGLSSARNAGIEKAVGVYLYMIDSDDYLEPDTLKLVANRAVQTKADLIVVGVAVHQIEGGIQKSLAKINRPDIILRGSDVQDGLTLLIDKGMYKYAWDKLYRRECVLNNNIWYNGRFDRVCEDTVFLYDLFPYLNCVTTVPQICYHYMVRDNQSVVKKYLPERFEKYLGRLRKLSLLGDYTTNKKELNRIVKKNYQDSVMWSIANMFHKDCNLNYIETVQFYKNMLEIDYTEQSFRKDALSTNRNDMSGTDHLLIKLYQYRMTFVMALITVFKRH